MAGPANNLDDLELIVRVGDATRRVRFDDRVLSLPSEVPLALPELAASAQQRIAVYARARLQGQDLGAVLTRPAVEELLPRYALVLQRACVATPCATPEPRRGASLGQDPRSRHLVLFGGRRTDGTALADTWEWDGVGWQSMPAASAPSARAGHMVAFDGRRGSLLLFGGAGGDASAPQPLADTWEYLGAGPGWQKLADSGPPARYLAAMASAAITYADPDPSHGPGVLLHGGLDASGHTLGDTWLWDGHTWATPLQQSDLCTEAPAPRALLPRCRSQAALIPAAAHSSGALLVGGRLGPHSASSAQPPEFDEVLWRWDGQSWSAVPLARPEEALARYGHFAGRAPGSVASSIASPQGVLIALGDSASGLRQDALTLDLLSGQLVPALGSAPAPRAESAMAYDDERDEALLLGGRGEGGPLGDTWTFTASAGWRAHK